MAAIMSKEQRCGGRETKDVIVPKPTLGLNERGRYAESSRQIHH